MLSTGCLSLTLVYSQSVSWEWGYWSLWRPPSPPSPVQPATLTHISPRHCLTHNLRHNTISDLTQSYFNTNKTYNLLTDQYQERAKTKQSHIRANTEMCHTSHQTQKLNLTSSCPQYDWLARIITLPMQTFLSVIIFILQDYFNIFPKTIKDWEQGFYLVKIFLNSFAQVLYKNSCFGEIRNGINNL